MGSSSKKSKEKENRKRRHRSPTPTQEYESSKEKRHKHKKHHHKEKRRERSKYSESEGSDIVEVVGGSPSPQRAKSPEPETSGKNNESLSIAETNKLRAKLGLKPLEVDSHNDSKKEGKDDGKKKDDLGEFYHKPAENWADKAQQEKIREKLAERREKRQLASKYSKVKTLGESDSDDDAESWVERNRRIELAKKQAEKRAKMLEELDEQFGVGNIVESEQRQKRQGRYTEKDLSGMQVEHDVDSFAEERDVILTLKDQGVLDDNEDVLVNVNMLDNERYKKNIENKTKKTLYNAYEDQEFDEFGNPKEKSLLSKYDEEIEGAKVDGFRIGTNVALERKAVAAQMIKEKLAKKTLESIGEKTLTIASDYYTEEEMMKFKKPKKKVRKIRTKGKLLTADDLVPNNEGIEDIGSRRTKYKNDPDLDIDDVPYVPNAEEIKIKLEDEKDDLLEKALHKTRKIKQKEDVIAEILKTNVKTETEEVDTGNIILNSTAEFCRTLGDIPTYGKSGNREETEALVDFEKEEQKEDSDDECQIIEPTGWNSVDPNQAAHSSHIGPQEVQILDEEPDVSTGVGAALKLAMSKGYLDKEQNNRPSNSRLAHLQAQHYSIEDKSYGDEGDRQNRRERYTGPTMEFREKDGFKPNVKLEYIDDEGHVLTSKEAFRYLSHKFHGKGPGKNKVEKRIKKGVQEQLMKKMSSTDTPLGTLNMLQAKQKETQSPFIVLSGNKQANTVISKTRR